MSTSLHAVFIVVFGNVYFVLLIFSVCGQKMQFSESSQNSISEKSIFGHFEVIFHFSQHINFSQGGGGYFFLAHSKWSF